jgi:hypothetical protein
MPFDAKSIAINHIVNNGAKMSETALVSVDASNMRNLTARKINSRIGRLRFEVSILNQDLSTSGRAEQTVKDFSGSITERLVNKNAREAIEHLVMKMILAVEMQYDIAGGVVINLKLTFFDGTDSQLGENGRPVTQVQMFSGEDSEKHILPGVDLNESSWNTMQGSCVIDWLHSHFKTIKAREVAKGGNECNKSGVRGYAHETTGKSKILKKFKEACPSLGEGITTDDIIAFAKHVGEMSVYGYSIDGTLVAQHISKGSVKRGCILFYISGCHFQPIVCKDVIESLTKARENSFLTKAATNVESEVDESEPVVVHGSEFGDYNESKIVCTTCDLEEVLQRHIKETGHVPQAWSRGTKIVILKAGKTVMVQNEHAAECEQTANQFGIPYRGEGPGSLAVRIAETEIDKSSTLSGYNEETKRIFGQLVSPHTKTVLSKPKKVTEVVQAFDIRRCYTNAILNRRDPWPVFTPNAGIEPFNGNIVTGAYYVDTENIFPLKKSGWYSDCLIRDCLDMGVIKLNDIKRQLIACKTLPADFFVPFVKSVMGKVEDKLAKKVVNYFIGCLGKVDTTSTSRCYVSQCEDVCFDIYQRLKENHGQYPCIRKCNDLYLTDYYIEKLHAENSIPIHRAIICTAWSACYKLFRKLQPCRLLAVSTDCVHVASTDGVTNPDPSVYREEPHKPDDWFFVEEVAVQEKVDRMEIKTIDVPPPETKDFSTHTMTQVGQSLMILADPGCGKTFYAIAFCKELDREGIRYIKLAPTNKAALNLVGKTIHSGLGLTVGSCELRPDYKKRISRLEYLIIDEISMVCGKIWDRLHKIHIMYPNLKFVIIGDSKQLPAVETDADAPRQEAVRTWAQAAVDRARRRFPGKPFDLTVEFLIERVHKIEGYSEVLSGQKGRLRTRMNFEHDAEDPMKASIDRIDCNLYYTQNNVRLVTKTENNERGTLSVDEFDQNRSDYVDYTTSRMVLELVGGRVMRMKTNYRSCKRMTALMNKFIEDPSAPVDIQKTKEIPRVNLAYTNRTCRRINSILMARELKGYEEDPLVVEAKQGAIWSQTMFIIRGTPLMCRQGKGKLMNGLMYDVIDYNEWGIEIMSRGDEPVFEHVMKDQIQDLFLVGYCVTVHKSQGDTIREPHAIHEWSRLSNRAKFTAMSRTDAWEKLFIYDDEKEFTETCDVRMAKYLLSRTDAELTEIMKKDVDQDFENDKRLVNEEWAEERRIKKSASKLKTTRDYCALVVKHDGNVPMRYQHAKERDFGRLFAIGPCLQRVPVTVRGALLRTMKAYDHDMCSAHPNLLRGIARDLDIACPALEEYCRDRAKMLNKTGLTKVDFLVQINKDKRTTSQDPFMIQFDDEVKQIQQAAWDSELFSKFPKDPERHNPKGSHLNLILCDRENAVLQKVLPPDAIGMFFDGFMSRRQLDIDELNNATAIHGIKWAYKPHDDSIQIPEGWEP